MGSRFPSQSCRALLQSDVWGMESLVAHSWICLGVGKKCLAKLSALWSLRGR